MSELPPLVAIKAERSRRSLAHFVREGWHVLEPETPLIWNWHIDAICLHLMAVSDGRIRRLLINIPPGHMKSLLVCVFWVAWMWLRRPSWRIMAGSYAEKLSLRDSVKCRDVMRSQWYQETFAPEWKFKPDLDTKGHFENTKSGFRIAMSVGGQGTGYRGDTVVFDDPLNVKEYPSDIELEGAIGWWDKRMSSRLNDMRVGARVGIMQRLHENDPSGHLIRRGGYDHLCLPTEFDPERRCKTSIGWEDPRKEAGELLFPVLFPVEVLAEARLDLGEYSFEGQHNQNPSPPGGGIWKKHWFRFWYRAVDGRPKRWSTTLEDGSVHWHEQMELPKSFDETWQSWDMTFKKKKGTDRVAGQIWATLKANRFLLAQVSRQMSFTDTIAAVREMSRDFPECSGKLVEDTANGPAVMDALQDEIGGFIPETPKGGKEARAHAAAPLVEAGNVYLPHPDIYPWVKEYIHLVTSFPTAAFDDEMDATTQLLNYLREHGTSILEALTR